MTITEADRLRLHQALVTQLGEQEAATLMEHLPPTGWADVATKTDLAHLQTAVDTRFDHFQTVMDARFDHFQTVMDARFTAMDAKLEARFNSHLRWMISTMIASYAVFATLAALATFLR